MTLSKAANTAMALAIFATSVVAGSAANAAGKSGFFYPHFTDGTQAYNSRVIAGAAPNWHATFIEGDRCSFFYRVVNGQRLRYQVCN